MKRLLFLAFFYGFIDRTAEDMTGNKEREKGPRPGVGPRSATEPQHMGRTLYPLS